MPLSKLGAKLVAVDSSIYMFDALIDEVKRQNLNIKCHLSSFEYFDPPICDVAICAFAANSLKDPYQFEKLYSKVRKYIFIITQTKSKEYEFSLYKILNFLNKEVKTSKPYLNIVKMLDEKNCAFSVNFFKINFHKTFKDYDDIYKFVCERLGEKLNRSMVFDLLKDEIIKYKDELILLNTKNCSVITVIKGG